jgi:hypothetical protein
MKKFEEIMGHNEDMFTEKIRLYNLAQKIDVKILDDKKQKVLYKLVKPNDLYRQITNCDIFVIINEEVFDELDDTDKEIIIDEILACIEYNDEKDSIKIRKYDFSSFSGLLTKYGFESIKRLNDLCDNIISQKNEIEKDLENK